MLCLSFWNKQIANWINLRQLSCIASSSTISPNFGFSEKHLAANPAIRHDFGAICKLRLLECPRSASRPAWALQAPHREITRNDISELILIQIVFLLKCRPKKPVFKPANLNKSTCFHPKSQSTQFTNNFRDPRRVWIFKSMGFSKQKHTPQSHIRVEVHWNPCWRIESNSKCFRTTSSSSEIHTWACLEQRSSGLTLLQFASEKFGTKFNVLSHQNNMEAKEGPVEKWNSGHGNHEFGHGNHDFLFPCSFSKGHQNSLLPYSFRPKQNRFV